MATNQKPPHVRSTESFEQHGYARDDITEVELLPVEGQEDLDIPGVLIVTRVITLDDTDSPEALASERADVAIPEKTLTGDELETIRTDGFIRFQPGQRPDDSERVGFHESRDRIESILDSETEIVHRGWTALW